MRTLAFMQGREVEFDEVSIDQAEDLRADGAAIIDVRRPDERAVKHVPGSIHLPMAELSERLHDVPEGRVLIICATGARSALAASMIEQSTGRKDVSSIGGGTDAWEAADKPINRG